MAVHVTEAERRRLGLAPKESILLTSRRSRALSLIAGTSLAALGGALLAAGSLVWANVSIALAFVAYAMRAGAERYYITQTRILVRHADRDEWHDLADVAGAQRERLLTSDSVLVAFRDERPPIVIPNVPSAHVVVAHILQVATRAAEAQHLPPPKASLPATLMVPAPAPRPRTIKE